MIKKEKFSWRHVLKVSLVVLVLILVLRLFSRPAPDLVDVVYLKDYTGEACAVSLEYVSTYIPFGFFNKIESAYPDLLVHIDIVHPRGKWGRTHNYCPPNRRQETRWRPQMKYQGGGEVDVQRQ